MSFTEKLTASQSLIVTSTSESAHYVVVKGEDFTFHRYSIAKFDISLTAEGDQR